MMKVLSKCALVAAVAALAFAGSTTASFAAKKKAAKAPAACAAWTYKTGACTGTACNMQRCGYDGKWYPSLMWCWQPACPK